MGATADHPNLAPTIDIPSTDVGHDQGIIYHPSDNRPAAAESMPLAADSSRATRWLVNSGCRSQQRRKGDAIWTLKQEVGLKRISSGVVNCRIKPGDKQRTSSVKYIIISSHLCPMRDRLPVTYIIWQKCWTCIHSCVVLCLVFFVLSVILYSLLCLYETVATMYLMK